MTLDSKDALDGYIRLYERQMAHYEKSQEIEWRGSFGIWTLLGAAIYWASTSPTVGKMFPVGPWTVVFLSLAPLLHAVWLFRMHLSEEFDKKLWARYRKAARQILLGQNMVNDTSLPPDEGEYAGLTFLQRMSWIVLEMAVTLALSGTLALIISRP